MHCLDIVWVVISPGSSHSFATLVVWYHVVVVREFFVANWTNSALLDNLPVEQLSHLSRGSQFPVTSWMMSIFDSLHSRTYLQRLAWQALTATTEE
jgi:hypothetical protein